jgi:hypothetical protein
VDQELEAPFQDDEDEDEDEDDDDDESTDGGDAE